MNTKTIDQLLTETVRMLLSVREENQQDLVPVLGLKWAAVNGRFTGKQAWKLREVEYLSEHFGCTPADLLQGKEHAVLRVMKIEAPRQRERASA